MIQPFSLSRFPKESLAGHPALAQSTLSALIRSLFRNGEQGLIYDPNDLTTLFQDSAGTVPVTAAGQPVGLMLDKRLGLVRGSDVIVNGPFESSLSGWAQSSPGYWSWVNGRAYHPLTGDYRDIRQPLFSLAGKWVEVRYTLEVLQGMAVSGVSGTTVYHGVGTHSVRIICRLPENALFFAARNGGWTAEFYLDNVSVCELPGNHALQPTAASRPILRQNATTGAYYLETDGVDDWMSTSAIDFTATDKVSVFAGVRKLSDAAGGVVCELSINYGSNTGFLLAAPSGVVAEKDILLGSSGAPGTYKFYRATGLDAPKNFVVSGGITTNAVSVAAAIPTFRIDGTTPASLVSSGPGTTTAPYFGNYPLYLFRRGGATLPFNGHFYGLTIVGRLCTAAEINNMERLLARNVGVQLA